MKLDFEQPLIAIDDSFVQYDGKDLTLGKACMLAVLNEEQGQQASGEDKFKRWGVAKKIKASEELSVDEVALIKERVGKCWQAQAVGPIYEILAKL